MSDLASKRLSELWETNHPIIQSLNHWIPPRRVPPGECGFPSSDGDPGTNGATSKTRCGCTIKTKSEALQEWILRFYFSRARKRIGAVETLRKLNR